MLAERSFVSVVCPCFNEQEVIPQFYQRLSEVVELLVGTDCELIFVDDGSSDETLAELNRIAANDPCVLVYSLSRNFGHQIALTAGLQAARGDAVIMMDSDLQHPPELLPQMIQAWREGYDVVSAVRQQTERASWFKRASSRAFYWLINQLSDTHVIPGAADFCLLSRRACDALLQLSENHRFLRGMVSWIGYPRTTVPFVAPPRAAGESKYNLRRMIALAIDAVISSTSKPLRMATRVGILTVLAGTAYLIYVLTHAIFLGDVVPGWASVISVVLILGGVQLAFLGLMGEYLSRVFDEVKRRPLYLLKQTPPGRTERPRAAESPADAARDEVPA